MNICMLTRALPAHTKGGVPDHSLMLARGLTERGHRVHLITTRLEGVTAPLREGNLTIHYLGRTRRGEYSGGWWAESARATRELHTAEPFDVIHCQSSSGYGIVNTGLHVELGVPAVVSQHGTYYDELVTRWKRGFSPDPVRSAKNIISMGVILAVMLRRDLPYLKKASGVIATSEEQYALIRRVYRVPEDRLFRVWNGMDLSIFTPGRADGKVRGRLGIPPGAPLILVVARFIRDKGIQNILRAMPAILDRTPECRLVIVGEGPYRARLERIAAAAGTSVIFAGEVPLGDLPGYFRECDIFVNPTNQQNGYDLTMVEAMACGKPVVSSNIGSTPTLITDGIDGVLFPTANVGELSRAVATLLGDPARRAELGTNARRKVVDRFDLGTMVDGTAGVYEKLSGLAAGPQQATGMTP
jgi:glycosyltransferase involved in cell wall biosynthesis